MTIRYELNITFGDADPAGIAYYPRILDFCHRAFETFFEKALGENYADVFMKQNVGYPTVHLDADFRAPMRFGDRMAVDVSICEISGRTVTFQYQFTRISDGTHCATIRNKAVAADRLLFKSVAIPPRHEAIFRAHWIAESEGSRGGK